MNIANVKFPSSLTSNMSFNSCFVSSENGDPLVSVAHLSSASLFKNAPNGGSRSVFVGKSTVDGDGVQYFAKICFKHDSSWTHEVS